MRIVSFIGKELTENNSGPRFGALLGNGEFILDFDSAIAANAAKEGDVSKSNPANPLAWLDLDGVWLRQASAAHDTIVGTQQDLKRATEVGQLLPRAGARLLAPVAPPGKLICIGLNYRDHAAESNMPLPEKPVIFSKFGTSVIGPEEPVVLPPTSSQVDYEAELAVVIGRRAKNVSRENALDYVLGYTIINDVSARDFQFSDGQWQRGKSCDTFAPMGESIVTKDEIPDPHTLSIKLRLNGKTMQDSNTDQLIFGVPALIAFLSETITLEPGDVIATGTPPGVGFARKPPVFLKHGDVMEVEIEKVGTLRSAIVAEAEIANAGKLAHSTV